MAESGHAASESLGVARIKIRLQLDEDVHGGLALAPRRRGFDAINAVEAGRLNLDDDAQLELAAQEHRCLVSFNVKDFTKLHNSYAQSSREHWGIIVSKQLPLGITLQKLMPILTTVSQEEICCQIRFL